MAAKILKQRASIDESRPDLREIYLEIFSEINPELIKHHEQIFSK